MYELSILSWASNAFKMGGGTLPICGSEGTGQSGQCKIFLHTYRIKFNKQKKAWGGGGGGGTRDWPNTVRLIHVRH